MFVVVGVADCDVLVDGEDGRHTGLYVVAKAGGKLFLFSFVFFTFFIPVVGEVAAVVVVVVVVVVGLLFPLSLVIFEEEVDVAPIDNSIVLYAVLIYRPSDLAVYRLLFSVVIIPECRWKQSTNDAINIIKKIV